MSDTKLRKEQNKKDKKKLKNIVNKVIEGKEINQLENDKRFQTKVEKTTPKWVPKQRPCEQWKVKIGNEIQKGICPKYCKTRGCKKRCKEKLLENVKNTKGVSCGNNLVEYPPLRF
jgi:hypothetical protein